MNPETLKEALLNREDIEYSCLYHLISIIITPAGESHSIILKLKDFLLQIYRILCSFDQDLKAYEAQAFILRLLIDMEIDLWKRIVDLDEFHVSVLGMSNSFGVFILWTAMGYEEIGKRLLSLQEIPEDIFLQVDSDGLTSLHQAIKLRQQELVKMYLFPESVLKNFPKKAVFIPDALGNSILHSAIENKDISMIDILLSSNYGEQLLKQVNNRGERPIDYLDSLMSCKIGKYSPEKYESIQSKIAFLNTQCGGISSKMARMERYHSTSTLDLNQEYIELRRRLKAFGAMIATDKRQLENWGQLQQEESLVFKEIQEKIKLYSNE